MTILRKFQLLLLLLTGVMSEGCLYSYTDYQFSENNEDTHGYYVRISSTLFYRAKGVAYPVDGTIVDSSSCFWSIFWRGNVDDSLRNVAHLESDSVWISSLDRKDTLRCNVVQDMTDGKWCEWTCDEITYNQLHSKQISINMFLRIVYSDGRMPQRFEIIWKGRQKTTKIHSDY